MYGKLRILVLTLTALLLVAGTARAAGLAPGAPGAAATTSVEEELEVIEEVEEEDPAEECSEAEVEYELGEISQEELELFCEDTEAEGRGRGDSATQTSKCPLRSAHAHAATSHNRLKVTLGYTAYEPFTAKLHLSNHLGSFKRHLGRAGVIRFTKHLGNRRPRKLVLQLRPVGVAGCPSRRLVLFSS